MATCWTVHTAASSEGVNTVPRCVLPICALLLAFSLVWSHAQPMEREHAMAPPTLSEVEVMRRVRDLIDLFSVPVERLELLLEVSLAGRPSSLEIERELSLGESLGLPPVAATAETRRRLGSVLGESRTNRYYLAIGENSLQRYEEYQSNLDMRDPRTPSRVIQGTVLVQGPEYNWSVHVNQARAYVTTRTRPFGESVPVLQNGWGECSIFLQAPIPMSVLREARGVIDFMASGERVCASLALPAELAAGWTVSVDCPAGAAWPVHSMTLYHRQSAYLSRWSLLEWTRHGSLTRPHRILIEDWRNVPADAIPSGGVLAPPSRPADFTRDYRAELLEFDKDFDSETFVYRPPDDYLVASENERGEWVMVAPAPTRSERQDRIRDRFGQARSPATFAAVLWAGGGLTLAATALIALVRWARR